MPRAIWSLSLHGRHRHLFLAFSSKLLPEFMNDLSNHTKCPTKEIDAKPRAVLRTQPDDFIVEEIPAYEASGEGEHLFVTFRKTGITTIQAVEQVAAALDIDPRMAGRAGLKDRHAIATQTVSLPFPIARGEEAESLLAGLASEPLEVLACKRHLNKLKPGHLKGNRFRITLRGLHGEAADTLAAAFQTLAHVPNGFGAQRFGARGDNAERALSWVRGEWRGPRQRGKQKLLFSALQSKLFNEVLARRVAEGTHANVIEGDLVKKLESGGMFLVSAQDLANTRQRAQSGELCATGPMFGAKMRWPEGPAQQLEEEILAAAALSRDDLKRFKAAGAGTRRPFLLPIAQRSTESRPAEGVLVVSFVLPKGGYATTVLSEICHLEDAKKAEGQDHAPPPSSGN